LQGIGYGETISYGELARRIGAQPAASRAVGLANGRNPVSIIVPCHRVIGADGNMTGYGGGLPRKRFLLDLERGAGLRSESDASAGWLRPVAEPHRAR
ncbi:MAG: methylated-DNA--[protein]-cysteine S-methyltransferase, partial [Streptosporangiaceae bacterium]